MSLQSLRNNTDTETWLVLGFTGSGKTSYILKRFAGRRVIIVSYAAQDESLKKFQQIEPEQIVDLLTGPRIVRVNAFRPEFSLMDILAEIQKHIHDSVVIVDDGKSEMGSRTETQLVRALGAVRHNKNELIFTFWSINHPPPFIYDMASHVLLFKSQHNNMRSLSVPRKDEMVAAYEWIQSRDAANYWHAHIVCNPMSELSHLPFFKVPPLNEQQ